ncbi:MAG: hypothetical protein FKY71_07895 [Spiribacter salinus]|uniref:Restriction endonuclease type IV Mrr domain-containing protein n=1 Tax=Spiribacter salinus TaxID=1335746 RepID=A0A540VS26_9GAMM|nr:MAG: hypothetical protein FKY71_07895 [Spiribacter salinus]
MSRSFEFLENEDAFEDLIADLVNAYFKPPLPAKRFGRRGQGQHGVDITWFTDDGSHRAAQCKYYLNAKLTTNQIDKDLAAAHDIEPPLQSLTFVTTNSRDRKLTEHVASCSLHGRSGLIDIWFGEDVERFLDHCGLGLRLTEPLIRRHMEEYLREKNLALVPVDSLGGHSLASRSSSPLAEEVAALLAAGRLGEVISKLGSPGVALDDELRLTLARAHYQRGDHSTVLEMAEAAPPSPRMLALIAVVHAHRGNRSESMAAAMRARSTATDAELPYVTALELSAMRLRGDGGYEALLKAISSALEGHPAIQAALGDAAQREGLDEEAITHYEAAIASDDRPSVLRRMALLAARLSQVAAKLPHADITLRDPQSVGELEKLREELLSQDSEMLDPGIRSVLQHNLSVVSMLVGDMGSSLEHARSALVHKPDNHDYWLRYGFALAVSGSPADSELLQRAPDDDGQIQLILADFEHRRGDLAAARSRAERALALPDLPRDLGARLEAQLIVADGPPELDDDRAEKLLERAKTSPFPGPFIIRVLSDPQLSAKFTEQLVMVIGQADFSQTDPRERVALAGMLVESGFLRDAVPFLTDLRNLLRLRDNTFDPSIAGVLIRILVATRRLKEADSVSLEWCVSDPENSYARWMRTSALLAGGQSEDALVELLQSPSALEASAPLLAQTIALARACGRLHDARRLVRRLDLPEPSSTNDRRALWFALSAVQDLRRLERLAIENLQPDVDLGPMAGELIHSIARIRESGPARSVRSNCVITLLHPDQGELTYWVGEGDPPLSGLGRGDWLSVFLGLTPGEEAIPTEGPFEGVPLKLQNVKPPLLLLHEHAQRQGQAGGQIRGFQGTPEDLIDRIREDLRSQQEATQRQLELGVQAGLPAVVMGEIFERSPREFVAASEDWWPRCHTGNSDHSESEDRVLTEVGDAGWIVDAVTVCIIVQTELEPFFRGLHVTPESREALRKWHLHERERFRALGVMSAGRGDHIDMQTFGASSRRSHRAFWGRVASFVERDCVMCVRPSDDVAAEFASLCKVLDNGTVSTLAAAKGAGLGLLSDELAIRQAFAEPEGIPTVSLRAFMSRAFRHSLAYGAFSTLGVVRAISRLATLERRFQSIPVGALQISLQAPEHERWSLLRALLPTLRDADPRHWREGLLLIMHNFLLRKRTRRAGVNSRALMRLVLGNLPLLPKEQYHAFADMLESEWTAVDRPTRRAVVRWLRRRS